MRLSKVIFTTRKEGVWLKMKYLLVECLRIVFRDINLLLIIYPVDYLC